MGLMLPSVAWGMEANTLPVPAAKPPATPLELNPDQPLRLEAEVYLVKGTSLDVLLDWVKRRGLPEQPQSRWSLEEAMDVVARPYNTALWHEGRGWGRDASKAALALPDYLQRYVADYGQRPAAKALGEKWAWAKKRLEAKGVKVAPPAPRKRNLPAGPEALVRGREIDWGKIDPAFDWQRFQKGITIAVMRWMVDHQDKAHKAAPPEPEAVRKGFLDGHFYDTINIDNRTYAGALIDPSLVMSNILQVLERERKAAKK
jgi:hypothetical protein